MCRTITSDGELAKDVELQLLATKTYAVFGNRKRYDAAGTYTFKVPAVEFHVVALGDKAHRRQFVKRRDLVTGPPTDALASNDPPAEPGAFKEARVKT